MIVPVASLESHLECGQSHQSGLRYSRVKAVNVTKKSKQRAERHCSDKKTGSEEKRAQHLVRLQWECQDSHPASLFNLREEFHPRSVEMKEIGKKEWHHKCQVLRNPQDQSNAMEVRAPHCRHQLHAPQKQKPSSQAGHKCCKLIKRCSHFIGRIRFVPLDCRPHYLLVLEVFYAFRTSWCFLSGLWFLLAFPGFRGQQAYVTTSIPECPQTASLIWTFSKLSAPPRSWMNRALISQTGWAWSAFGPPTVLYQNQPGDCTLYRSCLARRKKEGIP